MTHPKITIITISYNSKSTIEKTIESVISQDYQNKEYIIIDGGSTDGTQDVVLKYKDHIDCFISEKDNGRSDAFNKGIKHSTGDIICCINSDDFLLPNSLSKVAAEYDDEHDLFCGNVILWNAESGHSCVIHPSTDFPTMPFFRHPVHQGLFVKRSLHERIGCYDDRLVYVMDLDLLMRATSNKASFKRIDVDVAVFRLGGATNESIFKKRSEYVYLIRKNGGNIIQAYIYYLFMVFTQTIKKLLRFTGIDVVRHIRYKKKAI